MSNGLCQRYIQSYGKFPNSFRVVHILFKHWGTLSSRGFLFLSRIMFTLGSQLGRLPNGQVGISIAASGILNESLICWGIVAELALIKSRANEKSLRKNRWWHTNRTDKGGAATKSVTYFRLVSPPTNKSTHWDSHSHSHSLSWHSDSHSHLQ